MRLMTRTKLFTLTALLMMLGGFLALPTGGVSPVTGADGTACPVTIDVHGSTTLGPISDTAESPMQASRPGSDFRMHPGSSQWEGSGTGITSIRRDLGVSGLHADVGQSSRGLNAAEYTGIYVYKVARDGMLMAVRSSANMSFISNITTAQVKSIYESGYTGATWDDYGLGGPTNQIVMRSRITTSGTFPDFISLFGVNTSAEATTAANLLAATGLDRMQESLDMAQYAANNDYAISYTSLANVDVPNIKILSVDGVAGNFTTVSSGVYPKLRTLHYMLRQNNVSATGTPRIDNTDQVLADDWVNYIFTDAGQNLVGVTGFVPLYPGGTSSPPIPDWDVNMDGVTDIVDLGAITSKWFQSSTCDGWIRADANNNHTVSLGDIGVVIGRWGNPGFTPPVYP